MYSRISSGVFRLFHLHRQLRGYHNNWELVGTILPAAPVGCTLTWVRRADSELADLERCSKDSRARSFSTASRGPARSLRPLSIHSPPFIRLVVASKRSMSEEKDSSGSAEKQSETAEKTMREKEESEKRKFERMKYATGPRRRPRNAPSKFRD
jgi:hypothetical protein